MAIEKQLWLTYYKYTCTCNTCIYKLVHFLPSVYLGGGSLGNYLSNVGST